jgi:hypothetical protein
MFKEKINVVLVELFLVKSFPECFYVGERIRGGIKKWR